MRRTARWLTAVNTISAPKVSSQRSRVDGVFDRMVHKAERRAEADSAVAREFIDSYRFLMREIAKQDTISMVGWQGFIDDLTRWYIRLSRARFWREGDHPDKEAAYQTLYAVLTTFSRVLAPVLPFVCEAMYRNLVVRAGAPGPVGAGSLSCISCISGSDGGRFAPSAGVGDGSRPGGRGDRTGVGVVGPAFVALLRLVLADFGVGGEGGGGEGVVAEGEVFGEVQDAAGAAELDVEVLGEEVGGLVPVVELAVEAVVEAGVAFGVAARGVADHPGHGVVEVLGAGLARDLVVGLPAFGGVVAAVAPALVLLGLALGLGAFCADAA